jgi:hypothetical protein
MVFVITLLESRIENTETAEDVEADPPEQPQPETASPSGSSTAYVKKGRALGIIVEGEPDSVYESGRHEIMPFTSDGRYDSDTDWETTRFAVGERKLTVSEEADGVRTTSTILVEVTDPERVWQRAPDLDRPVESLVFDTGNQLTDEDEAIGDLPLERFAPALADCGLRVCCTGARRTRTETYELETLSGTHYEVSLHINETVRNTGADSDQAVLATLREGIQRLVDSESRAEQLDATTLAEQLDGEPGISVLELRPLETDPELEQESERLQ